MNKNSLYFWNYKHALAAAVLAGSNMLGVTAGTMHAAEPTGKDVTSIRQLTGQRLPDFVPLGPSILIGDPEDPLRMILLQRDKSAESSSKQGQLRYAVEPILNPVVCKDGPLTSLPWVHMLEKLPDRSMRVMLKFRLSTPELLEAAGEVIEVTEAETIAKAEEANGDQPIQVVVEKLPLTRLRIDLCPRFDLTKVLTYGEAEVTRVGNTAEIWMKVDAGTLTELSELAERKMLSFKPVYSYLNNRMVGAHLINVAKLNLSNDLQELLKAHNPSGDGLVSLLEISKFEQAVIAKTRTQLVVDHPEAGALMVNNLTQIIGAMFARATTIPFEQYAKRPGFDRQALARHLEPHGWIHVQDDVWENVKEQRELQRRANTIQGGVGVTIGNAKAGVSADVSASSVNEDIKSTAEKTGIVMKTSHTGTGYMPATVDLFRVLKENESMAWNQSMEVLVGLGSEEGVFDGSAFHQGYATDVIDDSLDRVYRQYHSLAEKYRLATRAVESGDRLLTGFEKALADETLLYEHVFNKSQACRGSALNVAGKLASVKYYEGLMQGYEGAGSILHPHHHGIDEEEADESIGHYGRWKAGRLAEARGKLEAKQAELREAETAHSRTLAECELENSKLVLAAKKVNMLATQIRSLVVKDVLLPLYPEGRSKVAMQAIDKAAKLLEKHAELQKSVVTVTAEEQKVVESILKAEADGRKLKWDLAQPAINEQYRSGVLHAYREGSNEYCDHVSRAHDEAEGRAIREWFNNHHVNPAQGALNAAMNEVNAANARQPEVVTQDKTFRDSTVQAATLHDQLNELTKDLQDVHKQFRGLVAEMIVAGGKD